jgi:hypothetical protein
MEPQKLRTAVLLYLGGWPWYGATYPFAEVVIASDAITIRIPLFKTYRIERAVFFNLKTILSPLGKSVDLQGNDRFKRPGIAISYA